VKAYLLLQSNSPAYLKQTMKSAVGSLHLCLFYQCHCSASDHFASAARKHTWWWWWWCDENKMSGTLGSDSGRLTFLKETAHSPEQLCVTTGKLYHSLCHWMVFTQIFVSYKSVHSVQARLHFCSMEVCMGKN